MAKAPAAPAKIRRLSAAEKALRQQIIEQCLWMNAAGLNQGTSGNISARWEDRMLITPTGTPYEALTPEALASVPLDGDAKGWRGPLKPSSEWRFHRDLLAARPDLGAVVHTHSTYATTLAIARKEILAVHYMIAVFGGPTVRCADYARYGTAALSRAVLAAMEDRCACLMANHGMIAAGPGLEKAMGLAVELETLAKQYFLSLQIGGGVILKDAQIEETAAAMKAGNYGV